MYFVIVESENRLYSISLDPGFGPSSGAGDFSAWYQVFLDGKWISLDARQ
jgi:hypothetical protein